MHLDGDGQGGNAAVHQTGDARVDESAPPASQVPEYLERYAPFIERNGWTPESFSADYSVPIRAHATRPRGHAAGQRALSAAAMARTPAEDRAVEQRVPHHAVAPAHAAGDLPGRNIPSSGAAPAPSITSTVPFGSDSTG